jgi:hypothetical protein
MNSGKIFTLGAAIAMTAVSAIFSMKEKDRQITMEEKLQDEFGYLEQWTKQQIHSVRWGEITPGQYVEIKMDKELYNSLDLRGQQDYDKKVRELEKRIQEAQQDQYLKNSREIEDEELAIDKVDSDINYDYVVRKIRNAKSLDELEKLKKIEVKFPVVETTDTYQKENIRKSNKEKERTLKRIIVFMENIIKNKEGLAQLDQEVAEKNDRESRIRKMAEDKAKKELKLKEDAELKVLAEKQQAEDAEMLRKFEEEARKKYGLA